MKSYATGTYEEMLQLATDFRYFRTPDPGKGIPDYSSAAMARHFDELKEYQRVLSRFDVSAWPVPRQVDYHVLRAQMNGLEFNHRVIKPWARDPGFYCTFPRFQETMRGAVPIPRALPLDESARAKFRSGIRALPELLAQARENLTEATADFTRIALRMKERERTLWSAFAEKVGAHHPELVGEVHAVLKAIDDFIRWLRDNRQRFTAPSGVGKENYNWFMKNVYLFPYTWDEAYAVVQRELERAHVFTRLEEYHNKELPEIEPVENFDESHRRFVEGQKRLFDFLEKEQIFKEPSYMEPKAPPSQWDGRPDGRNFFHEVLDRDILPLVAHDLCGHSPDSRRALAINHPMRPEGLPYHIAGLRAEGMATGIEELLMHMGLCDDRPRARELAYVLVGFRAARAAAAMKMHSNEMDFETALTYTAALTPRGYSKKDTFLLWDDLELYIRQPGYGMGYLMGKVQLEKMIADYSRLNAKSFSFREFFDAFLGAGMIPMSLIRWEITGLTDEMEKLLA